MCVSQKVWTLFWEMWRLHTWFWNLLTFHYYCTSETGSAWICKKQLNPFIPLSPHYQNLMGHLISTLSPWYILTWITLMSGTQGESFISLFGYLNSIKRGCGSMGVTGTSPLPISHPDALLCLGWLTAACLPAACLLHCIKSLDEGLLAWLPILLNLIKSRIARDFSMFIFTASSYNCKPPKEVNLSENVNKNMD